MKRKPALNKIPVIIGGALIALNYLALVFVPKIDLNSASPLEIYQQGIVEFFLASLG